MNIKILMITCNRPIYTRLSLKTLCDTVPENAKITIWDNGSERETIEILKKFEGHHRIREIKYNKTNAMLREPTNWFWENSRDADFLSKVDDDCLVPAGWCETLVQAHLEIPQAGIVGCWRFLAEDFREELAQKKIVRYGKHRIMRNCWVEGSGYLMKRAVLEKTGIIQEGETFTDYCLRAETKGFINGWYYPFLFQEHMDDPRTEHTGIKTEEDFQKLIPLSARRYKIDSREAWIQRLKQSAHDHQVFSYDPYDWIGIKAKIMRQGLRLIGRKYFPRVK